MVDLKTRKLEDDLRERIRRFADNRSKWCSPCYEALQKVREFDCNAFLCGGAVRDILLSNKHNHIIPRDLDIVLGYAEPKMVADSFTDYTRRWNCYGGVSIQIKDWCIDLWQLSETWAFKKKYVEVKGFADFPKTTFLDIDAIVVQLFKRKRQKREIYSKGFFEAILKKTIEINLEDNPNPAMCVVRSLRIATKFKFAIGPNLAKYIVHYAHQIGLEKLVDLYRTRYGTLCLSIDDFYCYIKEIKKQSGCFNKRPAKLPVIESKDYSQNFFWSDLTVENSKHLFAVE